MADDSAEFTKQIGLATDASTFGLGVRSERYAMIVKDGIVEKIEVETNFVNHKVSSADHMLAMLGSNTDAMAAE